MKIHPEAHAAVLAGTPGFHDLARTTVVGYGRPGAAILDVWCTCEPAAPVSCVNIALTPKKGELKFIERGRGFIEIQSGIDMVEHGHFKIESQWQTNPDGWQALGLIVRGSKRPGVKGSVKLEAKPSRLKKALAEKQPCACGDELGLHDPCSKCLCPQYHVGPPEKFARRKA